MKNIFLLYIFLLFSVFACKSKDSISEPFVNQPINFIDLPGDPAPGDPEEIYTEYHTITSSGGSIQFNKQLDGGPFGSFSISATLEIETGTIPVNEVFTCILIITTEKAYIQISPPEKNFAHPFKLNLKYTGIDLQNVNMNTLDFVCSNGTGETLGVEHNYITADYNTGTLEVKDALIQYNPILESGCICGFVSEIE